MVTRHLARPVAVADVSARPKNPRWTKRMKQKTPTTHYLCSTPNSLGVSSTVATRRVPPLPRLAPSVAHRALLAPLVLVPDPGRTRMMVLYTVASLGIFF